jgi:hypothetical protein
MIWTNRPSIRILPKTANAAKAQFVHIDALISMGLLVNWCPGVKNGKGNASICIV